MKALIIIFLCVAIFGSAGYFFYDLFVRPQKLAKADRAEVVATPPPDPGVEQFEAGRKLQREGKSDEAANVLENFIANFSNSAHADEAREILGGINLARFMTPGTGPGKEVYVVKKGDVLMKIATKMHSTPELISHANHLRGIILHIGDQLTIPQPHFSLVINRKQQTVTLLNDGRFFKLYRPQKWGAPAATSNAPIATKVLEKVALKEGQRVAFGTSGFEGSTRWIRLALPGYTLFSTDPQRHASAPAGIEMTQKDMEELSALLSRNTSVRIE